MTDYILWCFQVMDSMMEDYFSSSLLQSNFSSPMSSYLSCPYKKKVGSYYKCKYLRGEVLEIVLYYSFC